MGTNGKIWIALLHLFLVNIGVTRLVLRQRSSNNLPDCAEQAGCVLSSHDHIPTAGNSLCAVTNLSLLIALNTQKRLYTDLQQDVVLPDTELQSRYEDR